MPELWSNLRITCCIANNVHHSQVECNNPTVHATVTIDWFRAHHIPLGLRGSVRSWLAAMAASCQVRPFYCLLAHSPLPVRLPVGSMV